MSLFRRPEQRSGVDASWFGTGEQVPGRITAETATYLTPVFAAIRHIVDFASSLPVDAYRPKADGSRESVPLPPLLRNENAPGRAGMNVWIGQAFYGLVTQGNAVGWIVETDGFGFPSVVRWLNRYQWEFDEAAKQWYVFGKPVPSSQLVHIPWIVPSGCTLGLSPIEHAAAVVRAGLSAQEYADVKRGGGLPPAHLKNTRLTLDQDQSAAIQSKAVASFSSGKPFVSGSDWDLSLLSIPPNHAQFIETTRQSAASIAAMYGIDPREIGGTSGDSLTYKTDESRSLNRANDLRPYIVRFEQGINRLIPNKQFIKLNVDSTIRTDIKTRTDVLGAEIADGRRSVNEARTLLDLPPVDGGDFHNVPSPTSAPATRIGETP